MSDYKELIDKLRESEAHMGRFGIFARAVKRAEIKAVADAIEQLRTELDAVRKERDAAVRELQYKSACYTCANDEYCHGTKSKEPDLACGNYEWRGVQERVSHIT